VRIRAFSVVERDRVTHAIGGIFGIGIAVAVSPIPIAAVILVVTSRRGRANGLLFELGWIVGLALLGLIGLALLGSSASSTGGPTPTWRGWVLLAAGLTLLLVGVVKFRRRPPPGTEVQAPKWMAALDRTTPTRALGLGALLAVVNPKNGPLTLAAAASIASTEVSPAGQVVALSAFVLIASIGITVPLTLYLVVGAGARPQLARWRAWVTRREAVIVSVLALVLGLGVVLAGAKILV
jgi:threonine/homoserine/homoserine lactone efflux protein